METDHIYYILRNRTTGDFVNNIGCWIGEPDRRTHHVQWTAYRFFAQVFHSADTVQELLNQAKCPLMHHCEFVAVHESTKEIIDMNLSEVEVHLTCLKGVADAYSQSVLFLYDLLQQKSILEEFPFIVTVPYEQNVYAKVFKIFKEQDERFESYAFYNTYSFAVTNKELACFVALKTDNCRVIETAEITKMLDSKLLEQQQ